MIDTKALAAKFLMFIKICFKPDHLSEKVFMILPHLNRRWVDGSLIMPYYRMI